MAHQLMTTGKIRRHEEDSLFLLLYLFTLYFILYTHTQHTLLEKSRSGSDATLKEEQKDPLRGSLATENGRCLRGSKGFFKDSLPI